MKRLLLGLMLLVTATAASAEWIFADANDESIQYVDRATIRRNGNLVKMWDMVNYKTVQGGAVGYSYLSSKAQSEYDCKEERFRLLALNLFDGQMGSGKVVISDSTPGPWAPISPGSRGEIVWKIACGKK